MPKIIRTTFGSKSMLVSIIKKHPEYNMHLLKPTSPANDYQLVDNSQKTNAFHLPHTYLITREYSPAPIKGYLHFLYFNLSPDDAKLFLVNTKDIFNQADKIIDLNNLYLLQLEGTRIQFVIMASFDRDGAYYDWLDSPLSAHLKMFRQRSAGSEGFHESVYTLVQPQDY